MKVAVGKIDPAKAYSLTEALGLVKETSKVKFDATIEVHVVLNVDPKKTDQLVRSTVTLPHGTGKTVRVAAFVADNEVAKAKAAGADLAGSDDLIEQIKTTSKCDFDVAVATPDMMKKLAVIARVLGQKGLMPNPKTGTIAPDVTKLIAELKAGKVTFKREASGVIHAAIGKVSFPTEQVAANIETLIDAVRKAKPVSIKGALIKSVYVASSMGPSVKVSL